MTDVLETMGESVFEERYENYAILSRLLRVELDAELLQSLIDSPAPEETGSEAIDAPYAEIRAYLDAADAHTKSELAIDYMLAFIGYPPDPNSRETRGVGAAYPYESVYVSQSGNLLEASTMEVTALYHADGFSPTKERIDFDDHVACELEYLQFLTGLEIIALREREHEVVHGHLLRQKDFIEAHMLTWLPDFAARVQDFAETSFYRALARLSLAFVESDLAFIKRHLAE